MTFFLIFLIVFTSTVAQDETIDCGSETCECITSGYCVLNCIGDNSCKDKNILCGSATQCEINCEGDEACRIETNGFIIDCSGVALCTLHCDTGAEVCLNVDVTFRETGSFQCSGSCGSAPDSFTATPTTAPTNTVTRNPASTPSPSSITTSNSPSNPPSNNPSISPNINTNQPSISTMLPTYVPTGINDETTVNENENENNVFGTTKNEKDGSLIYTILGSITAFLCCITFVPLTWMKYKKIQRQRVENEQLFRAQQNHKKLAIVYNPQRGTMYSEGPIEMNDLMVHRGIIENETDIDSNKTILSGEDIDNVINDVNYMINNDASNQAVIDDINKIAKTVGVNEVDDIIIEEDETQQSESTDDIMTICDDHDDSTNNDDDDIKLEDYDTIL